MYKKLKKEMKVAKVIGGMFLRFFVEVLYVVGVIAEELGKFAELVSTYIYNHWMPTETIDDLLPKPVAVIKNFFVALFEKVIDLIEKPFIWIKTKLFG